MQRILASVLVLFIVLGASAQTSSQRASVQLAATVQASPPRITLNWTSISSTTSITIYRKLKTATSWGTAIATPAAADLSWQDNNVVVGTAYEYRVVRVSNGVTGQGYVSSGIQVQPPDFRGRVILLVDNTFTSPLSAELQQLERDLRADGWGVIRSDVSPSATVPSVRSIIQGHYNADPTNVKAVYMIGHVPVPYSGNVNPDGHSEHQGAWPCDGYYGELNGNWTDNTVNNNGAQRAENRNIPSDGKFDQSNFPSDLELQVGRVDLTNMPAFPLSATELMRAYLNRAHDFKLKGWVPQQRALMFDNLQWVSNPLAASGWRSMAALVGAGNITNANQNGTPFHQLVNGQSYMWTYSSGAGGQASDGGVLTFNGATNIATTQNLASTSMGGVFNMTFGSYFGDWDNRNNFLRAYIAGGSGLASVWSAIPGYYYHHMGMGDPIGYSTLLTMNNSSLYTPLHDGWQGSIGRTHLGLMGDPTLRMKMVAPPANVVVSNSAGAAAFSWAASPETGIEGYHVYEFAADGSINRLTSSPVLGTGYTNAAIPFVTGREYMVRTVKLEVSNTGSYYNLSLGAMGTAQSASSTDCLGVPGGSATPGTPCNDGNACTSNDAWNASCQCVGALPQAPNITAISGNGPICVGQNINLNASASGSGTLTYAWTGPNGFTSTSLNPSINSATAAASGVYTLTVSNGCSSSQQTVGVTVNTPPTATINYVGSPFCASAGVVSVTRTGNSGGSYSVTPTGLSINTGNGNVTPSTSTPGTYTVTYTLAAAGGCPSFSTTASITIAASFSATISYGTQPICTGSGTVNVTRTGTSGGTYSAAPSGLSIDSSAGAINPGASTAGTYTVTYTIAASGGCAAFSTTASVSITAGASATITYGASPICSSSESVNVTRTGTSGGTYSAAPSGLSINSSTGAINPGASTAGTYTVTYSIAASGGCAAFSTTASVSIMAGPSATITYGASPFCSSSGSVNVTRTGTSGGAYSATPSGLSINNSTGAINPGASTAGTYTVTYTIAASGGCAAFSTTASVSITAGASATITYGASPICSSSGSVNVTRTGTSGGTYSAAPSGLSINSSTGAINPGASTAGTYTVTYSIAASGGCAAFSTTAGVSITAATTWYADMDGDGAGDPAMSMHACSQPQGYVANATDGCPNDPNKNAPGNCGCGNLEPGASCNDGDSNTVNDMIGANCSCAGTPLVVDCLGMPGGSAVSGTPCNDNNPNTGNDTWNSNCQCMGQLIDCMGTPGGSAVSGTPCNDNNPNTGNDTWNSNCQCMGQLIDCMGTPGGSALPGTPCNDGNANTVNDAWNNQCFCIGEQALLDCAGVVNGSAFIDACGQCAGGSTGVTPNPDGDADGVLDCDDNCLLMFNPNQADFDGDGIGDGCDNCTWVYNPDQNDTNEDGVGDACELVTGVQGSEVGSGFSVAPNPIRGGLLQIRLASGEARRMRVTNAAGKQIIDAPWRAYLDCDALAMGIYTIVALDAEGRPLARTRFVKN